MFMACVCSFFFFHFFLMHTVLLIFMYFCRCKEKLYFSEVCLFETKRKKKVIKMRSFYEKMLNEDILGHLPLKIDVIPAVVVTFFTPCGLYYCNFMNNALSLYICFKSSTSCTRTETDTHTHKNVFCVVWKKQKQNSTNIKNITEYIKSPSNLLH